MRKTILVNGQIILLGNENDTFTSNVQRMGNGFVENDAQMVPIMIKHWINFFSFF